jgi:hypothetical protein
MEHEWDSDKNIKHIYHEKPARQVEITMIK